MGCKRQLTVDEDSQTCDSNSQLNVDASELDGVKVCLFDLLTHPGTSACEDLPFIALVPVPEHVKVYLLEYQYRVQGMQRSTFCSTSTGTRAYNGLLLEYQYRVQVM